MKKILFITILMSLVFTMSYVHCYDWLDEDFISPIRYKGSLPIRNDDHGKGHFGAPRRGGRSHRGLDIYAPLYTDVMASKSGIAKVGFVKNGMGKYVIIRHANGCATLYGHLSRIRVKNNQRVRQGAIIGHVGKTGNAKYKNIDPHLHFEIRKSGRCVDPLLFIG
ncbi:MAG: M23 family metallopeptidase [Candidatus Omnitrophica bacterium]|nr:M23 family metallopeptidase [Candidatus Omnitrophota bacterium]